MVETLADAVPPITAVVSDASQVMLNPAGIRIRMSFAVVIEAEGVAAVTVMVLMAVTGSPAVKV